MEGSSYFNQLAAPTGVLNWHYTGNIPWDIQLCGVAYTGGTAIISHPSREGAKCVQLGGEWNPPWGVQGGCTYHLQVHSNLFAVSRLDDATS